MCQLAGPGAISFPEAATLDDTDGSGLMAGPPVRGLRSGCSASDKAALMPMIPQCGAEEPFDETLEAIDAAIDAELEEQHHALPLRHKKKVLPAVPVVCFASWFWPKNHAKAVLIGWIAHPPHAHAV